MLEAWDMKRIVNAYLDRSFQNTKAARRKISTEFLEAHVRTIYSGEFAAFQQAGGYVGFCSIISELVDEGRLEPVKKAGGNGREPELQTTYWLYAERPAPRWSEMDMVRWSDRLKVSFYVGRPMLQTDEERDKIERVYRFLLRREHRAWVTREERSLELFGDEKWLSEEQGEQFMRRIGLTLDDLRARIHGEPFVFWPRPGVRLHLAAEALIVENLSMFHTIRRVLEQQGHVLQLRPDLLIYGEGKKIEASLSFLNEIATASSIQIYYAGDIDPEGWGIYARLKGKYRSMHIRPAIPLYEAMVRWRQTVPIAKGQMHAKAIANVITDELRFAGGSDDLVETVSRCWRDKVRIPQEVLTVERLGGGGLDGAAVAARQAAEGREGAAVVSEPGAAGREGPADVSESGAIGP